MSVATPPAEKRYGLRPQDITDVTALLQFRVPGFKNESMTPFLWCKIHVRGFADRIRILFETCEEDKKAKLLRTIVNIFNVAINRPEAPWMANKPIDPNKKFLGNNQGDHVRMLLVTESAD